ncbi:hypothetical protein AVEN_146970-1, partial [Araneus ventricosus]
MTSMKRRHSFLALGNLSAFSLIALSLVFMRKNSWREVQISVFNGRDKDIGMSSGARRRKNKE